MNKMLILLFHPRLESSRVNQKIHGAFAAHDHIVVKDMYDLYPDFNIDVKKEQHDLLKSDLIIMQHPMYWYAAPPLYKQWIDLVLEYGWAYGKNGDKLKGKNVFHIISSGGSYESYCKEGRNLYTYQELLRPFELTYKLCQMKYWPPYIISAANRIENEAISLHGSRIQTLTSRLASHPIEEIIPGDITYLNDIKLS